MATNLYLLFFLQGAINFKQCFSLSSPAQNFNLTVWKLQLPVDSNNGFVGPPSSVWPITSTYTNYPYFYTSSDNAMVFYAPFNGVTTSGSIHPRSELRQMKGPYMTLSGYFWNMSRIYSSFSATLAVNQLALLNTGQNATVVIAQIHAPTGEQIRLYYQTSGAIYWSTSPPTGTICSSINRVYLYSSTKSVSSIPLNTKFSYNIQTNITHLFSYVYFNNTVYKSIRKFDVCWTGINVGAYYKAGCYCQVNNLTGKFDGSGACQVSYYDVSVPKLSITSFSIGPVFPSIIPTIAPSNIPSTAPSKSPSITTTFTPSNTPSTAPSKSPSITTTFTPSTIPSIAPSKSPSITPTVTPSIIPSTAPSKSPSITPTFTPSDIPSAASSKSPSFKPTVAPITLTLVPSVAPTKVPTRPTVIPTKAPISKTPTRAPTRPTRAPTKVPTRPTVIPTKAPISKKPTRAPTRPTRAPTRVPTRPTFVPTKLPTVAPTTTKNPSGLADIGVKSEKTVDTNPMQNTTTTLAVVIVFVSFLAILATSAFLYFYYKKNKTITFKDKSIDEVYSEKSHVIVPSDSNPHCPRIRSRKGFASDASSPKTPKMKK